MTTVIRNQSNGYEVVEADRRLRWITVLALALSVLVCGAAIYWLDSLRSDVEQWVREDPASAVGRLKAALQILFVTMGVIPVAVGILLLRVSRRVLEQQRYPPAGMRVIVNTVVVRGERARRIGVVGIICSVVMVVAGVAGSVMGLRVLEIIAG